MRLSRRILLYFSASIIAFIGFSLWVIYLFFADYRRDEFWQRLEDESDFALRSLIYSDSTGHAGTAVDFMDDSDDERMLIFDRDRRVFYNSLGNVRHFYSKEMLDALSADNPEVEQSVGGSAIKGLYRERGGKGYYIITKASDQYGLRKQAYLRYLLLGTFAIACVLVVLISHYLARQITAPLEQMAREIEHVHLDNLQKPLDVQAGNQEIGMLAAKFNEMRERLNQAVQFQNHFVQHVSHELKTPIAVMVSNLERGGRSGDVAALQETLAQHKKSLRELADILDALVQIAKAESGEARQMGEEIRMDELLFQVADELRFVYDDFAIEISFSDAFTDERQWCIKGNKGLVKALFRNLFKNAYLYRDKSTPVLKLSPLPGALRCELCNDGPTLTAQEAERLYQHFFRGGNSSGHTGFGLGLALARRIVELHSGLLEYSVSERGWNCFKVEVPL